MGGCGFLLPGVGSSGVPCTLSTSSFDHLSASGSSHRVCRDHTLGCTYQRFFSMCIHSQPYSSQPHHVQFIHVVSVTSSLLVEDFLSDFSNGFAELATSPFLIWSLAAFPLDLAYIVREGGVLHDPLDNWVCGWDNALESAFQRILQCLDSAPQSSNAPFDFGVTLVAPDR